MHGLLRIFRFYLIRFKLDSFTIFHLNFIDLYDIIRVHPDFILLEHMLFLHFNTLILGFTCYIESIKMILCVLIYLAYLRDVLYQRQHLLFAQTYLIIGDVIAHHTVFFVHTQLTSDLSHILYLIGGGDTLLRLHELDEEKEISPLFTCLIWMGGVCILDEETVKRAFLRFFQLKLSISIHFY